MKKLFVLSLFLCIASLIFAQPQARVRYEVITGSAQANEQERQLMKTEAANHPRVAEAINKLKTAYAELKNAPDDFGGHKVQAMSDTQAAIISLRKALYYRLYADTGR